MKRSKVLDNQWVTILEDQYQLPNGADCTYYHALRNDAVMIIAIDVSEPSPMTFIVKQYRHPIGKAIWQFPLGGFDHLSVEPADAAREELAQETGVIAGEISYLGAFYADPGFTNQRLHVCATHDIQHVTDQSLEDTEQDLICKRVEVSEISELVRLGEMGDAWGIAGLHYVSQYVAKLDKV